MDSGEQLKTLTSPELIGPNDRFGIIDSVIDEYSTKTADELSDITHQKNSLWSKIVEKQKVTFVDGKSDVEIPTGYTKGMSD